MNIAWARQAAQARADLAKALHVEEQHIIISGAEQTQWSDSGMECGGPTEELRSGPFDWLRHYACATALATYTFHTDMKRVIACPEITTD